MKQLARKQNSNVKNLYHYIKDHNFIEARIKIK